MQARRRALKHLAVGSMAGELFEDFAGSPMTHVS